MENKTEKEKTPSFFISVRFLTAIIIFFGYCFQYMIKINISIGIVCMINNTALSNLNPLSHSNTTHINASLYYNNTVDDECPAVSLTHKKSIDGPFLWPKSTQGMILAAYFYGYLATQIAGGWLSLKIGGRRVLFVSMLIASALTLLIPVCARLGHIALIVNRVIIGAAHGVFWPSTSQIWSRWAPPNERAMLAGTASAGSWVGNIIALPLAGYLCVNGFDGGWPSIFYIFGILCTIWCIAFWFVSADTPESHRFISEIERDYILKETSRIIKSKDQKTPWFQILTSKACIAIYCSHFASNWGIYLFLTQLPTFLKDVLKFDIKSNGLLSAIPYLCSCGLNVFASITSDKIAQSGKLSRTNVRRIFNSLGLFIPCAAIIGLSFVNCKMPALGMVLLTIGISFASFTWGAGHLVNINEVAGPFSGILFGVSNTIATVPGIVAPYIVGVITTHQTQKEWQIVFIICVVISFVGGCIYILLCDSNVQPWAVRSESCLQLTKTNSNGKFNSENVEEKQDYITRL